MAKRNNECTQLALIFGVVIISVAAFCFSSEPYRAVVSFVATPMLGQAFRILWKKVSGKVTSRAIIVVFLVAGSFPLVWYYVVQSWPERQFDRHIAAVAAAMDAGNVTDALISGLYGLETEAEGRKDRPRHLKAVRLQGDCYRVLGKAQEAEERYTAVWAEVEGRPWPTGSSPDDRRELAGSVFGSTGSLDEKREFAYAIRGLGDLAWQGRDRDVAGQTERLESALTWLDLAIGFFDHYGDSEGLARTTLSKAEILRAGNMGRLHDAEAILDNIRLPANASPSLKAMVEFEKGRVAYDLRNRKASAYQLAALRLLAGSPSGEPVTSTIKRLKPVSPFAARILMHWADAQSAWPDDDSKGLVGLEASIPPDFCLSGELVTRVHLDMVRVKLSLIPLGKLDPAQGGDQAVGQEAEVIARFNDATCGLETAMKPLFEQVSGGGTVRDAYASAALQLARAYLNMAGYLYNRNKCSCNGSCEDMASRASSSLDLARGQVGSDVSPGGLREEFDRLRKKLEEFRTDAGLSTPGTQPARAA